MDPRLVVLVFGVEAGLEVVDKRRGGRYQLTDDVIAVEQQLRAGVRGGGGGRRGREGGGHAPLAPLRYLALDVERASLRPATVG